MTYTTNEDHHKTPVERGMLELAANARRTKLKEDHPSWCSCAIESEICNEYPELWQMELQEAQDNHRRARTVASGN